MIHALIATVLLIVLDAEKRGKVLTSEAVLAEINRDGAAVALRAVYRDDKKWTNLLAGIGSGTRSWLEVAKLLEPVADAGPGEDLSLAVGEALEHRPGTFSRWRSRPSGLNQYVEALTSTKLVTTDTNAPSGRSICASADCLRSKTWSWQSCETSASRNSKNPNPASRDSIVCVADIVLINQATPAGGRVL